MWKPDDFRKTEELLSETLKKYYNLHCLNPGREAPKIVKKKCLKIYKKDLSYMI